MRFTSLVTVFLVPFGLAACGGNQTIKSADQAAINSVSVATEVKIPNEPIAVGSGPGYGLPFGAIGASIAAYADKTDAQSFSEFLKASGIDIGEIVRQRFTDRLKNDPFYGSRLASEGNYRFVIEIPSYGINKTSTFSSKWVANLSIRYKIVSPEGKVLGEDMAMTTPLSERAEFTIEELNANPQLMKEAFENVASSVSAKLFKN